MYQPNRIINVHIYVGTTGLVDGDFTKTMLVNGAVSGTVTLGTITEIGSSGIYTCTFTPDVEGDWDPIFEYDSTAYTVGSPYNVVDLETLVNGQVVDVMNIDTWPEMSALPGATPTLLEMIRYVYQFFRFKKTATATLERMFKADGATVIGSAGLFDDGTTFTKDDVS